MQPAPLEEDLAGVAAEPTPEEIAAAAAELEEALLDDGSMLLERDAFSGAVEKLHFDEGADTFTIERVVDVEPVLDWCKGRYNEGIANRHCEFRQIASIPPEVLELWARLKRYNLPGQWYLQKQYHHLVVEAAHDRDLSGFRTLAGEFRRRGDA